MHGRSRGILDTRASPAIFGLYNIFGKLAAILGPFLIGLFSQHTHCFNV